MTDRTADGLKGRYLSDLIAIADGDKDVGDAAFFNALHVDRTVAGCATFRLQIMGRSSAALRVVESWARVMVDRYAKYATEHLAVTASRIENERGGNVIKLPKFQRTKS